MFFCVGFRIFLVGFRIFFCVVFGALELRGLGF